MTAPTQPRNPQVGEVKGGRYDGTALIDADACALALFVTHEGRTHVKSPYGLEDVAGMLRQIADNLEKRAQS